MNTLIGDSAVGEVGVSSSPSTLSECGSYWWFQCVRSRGLQLRRSWQRSPVQSTNAEARSGDERRKGECRGEEEGRGEEEWREVKEGSEAEERAGEGKGREIILIKNVTQLYHAYIVSNQFS